MPRTNNSPELSVRTSPRRSRASDPSYVPVASYLGVEHIKRERTGCLTCRSGAGSTVLCSQRSTPLTQNTKEALSASLGPKCIVTYSTVRVMRTSQDRMLRIQRKASSVDDICECILTPMLCPFLLLLKPCTQEDIVVAMREEIKRFLRPFVQPPVKRM